MPPSKPTILIVDDMAVFSEPIATALRFYGFQALCASDGIEALAIMRQDHPELVLLDLAMPRMDGTAVLRAKRMDPHIRDIPVILLTAAADRDSVLGAARLGVRQYLLKSTFSLGELLGRINATLEESGVATGSTGRLGTTIVDETAPPPRRSTAPGVDEVEPGAPASSAVADNAATPRRSSPQPTMRRRVQIPDVESFKDLKPFRPRSEMQELLDNFGELQALSPTLAQVMKLTRQKDCSIERVAQAIRQDQALALKVLKLSNSAGYLRGEPLASVEKAVLRVGLSAVRQMVQNIVVVEHFSDPRYEDVFDMNHFWEHGIACALLASEIANEIADPSLPPDDAFTMGLLHDVGRIVYLDVLCDEYIQVLEIADQLQLPVEQIESRALLINHADAMDRLLHAWGFANQLINPIAFHHLSAGNMRRTSPKTFIQSAALGLANRLAHAMLLGSSGNDVLYPIWDFVEALRLKPSFVQRLYEEVPGQAQDLRFAIVSDTNTSASWTQAADQYCSQLTAPLHPVCISPHPEAEALSIFLRQIAGPPGDEPPNLAVVHLSSGSDREAMTDTLKDIEAKAGVENLPLVVVSPAANIKLDDRTSAQRQIVELPFPFKISRIIDAFNHLVGSSAGAKAA